MSTKEMPRTGASISELAVEWGISEGSLYKLAAENKLPGCRRLGRRFIVHRATFEEWVRTGKGS